MEEMTLPPLSEESLRDWFAGMAMQALIQKSEMNVDETSERAYKYADRMIEERMPKKEAKKWPDGYC